VRYRRWRITVERDGARRWFRLRLGRSVVADWLWSEADLVRELARYGLTLADFEDDARSGDGEP
jgi:hypothetical protein